MYESTVVWVNMDDPDQAYSELGRVLVNLTMLGSVSPSVGRSMIRVCVFSADALREGVVGQRGGVGGHG